MPNETLAASAAAMPIDRRRALGSLAAAAAAAAALIVPAVAVAAASAELDAEIIALSAEILRRAAEAEHFQETRIDLFQEEFDRIAHSPGQVTDASLDEAFAFSRKVGREDAIRELQDFDEVTDRLFKRLMSIPAKTQPGRAAKVRALLVHVSKSEWPGPASELDWDKEMTRALLGEFAGMSAAELEEI
jgi:hypothetical protein